VKTRPPIVLAVIAALAAWVSAQPGFAPSAADSLRMLKANRGLYDDLTTSALALADRHTSLDRADECRKVADRLAREAREAVDRKDADRLAEVSDHLHAVTADGLAPNLADARRDIAPQSQDYRRLQEVHQQAFDSLTRTANSVPTDGALGTSKRAQAAREKLAAAAARIGPPPADKDK
jgi:ribosomal protein L17